MAIASFPTQLVPLIQQGFLAREFEEGLRPRLGYRAVADRMIFPNQIGQTITMTRKGLKVPATTPLTPSANTNFDNGLTPTAWAVEQFTLGINQYGDTIDLNMVTERVGTETSLIISGKSLFYASVLVCPVVPIRANHFKGLRASAARPRNMAATRPRQAAKPCRTAKRQGT